MSVDPTPGPDSGNPAGAGESPPDTAATRAAAEAESNRQHEQARIAREMITIAVAPPRRLRLDELLRELGARDADHDGADDRSEGITIGTIVDKAAEAGFGFLIGMLTLIAIPFFGLSTPFGLAIAVLGAQLMLGRTKPWLPKRVCTRKLSMAMLDRVLAILTKRTAWISRSTRRRYEFLIRPRLIGFGIVLLALALALPLPIPGSNLVFLIPIFIYSVGLLERDGVWIALGHVGAVADTVLLFLFGATVLAVLSRIWNWIF